jgi:hypothetical protein
LSTSETHLLAGDGALNEVAQLGFRGSDFDYLNVGSLGHSVDTKGAPA